MLSESPRRANTKMGLSTSNISCNYTYFAAAESMASSPNVEWAFLDSLSEDLRSKSLDEG
jgi:hypothetical protein